MKEKTTDRPGAPPDHKRTVPFAARIAIAAGLLFILCVVLWLLWGNLGVANTCGEDTPYPYTWTVKHNGTALLSLKNDADSGCVWQADGYAEALLTVELQPVDGDDPNTTFLLTPLEQGLTTITFRYQKDGDPADQRFVWTVPTYVSEDSKLSFEPGSYWENAGVQQGKTTKDTSLCWQAASDGTLSLELAMADESSYGWIPEFDPAILTVSSPVQSDGVCTIIVQGLGAGETELTLVGTPRTDSAPQIHYTLSLVVADQQITVTQDQVEEIPSSQESEPTGAAGSGTAEAAVQQQQASAEAPAA